MAVTGHIWQGVGSMPGHEPRKVHYNYVHWGRPVYGERSKTVPMTTDEAAVTCRHCLEEVAVLPLLEKARKGEWEMKKRTETPISPLDMHHPSGQLSIARINGGEYRDLVLIEIRNKATRQVVVELYIHPEHLTFALTGAARQPCHFKEEGPCLPMES